jgi:hypothetical protein
MMNKGVLEHDLSQPYCIVNIPHSKHCRDIGYVSQDMVNSERSLETVSISLRPHLVSIGYFLRFILTRANILTNPPTLSPGVHNHRMAT